MARKSAKAETEKKVTVSTQEKVTPATEPTSQEQKKVATTNPTVVAIEKKVIGSIITGNSWDIVSSILANYKWHAPEHNIIIGAVRKLRQDKMYINTANVQLMTLRLYPDTKVNVYAYVRELINPAQLVPFAHKLVELSK